MKRMQFAGTVVAVTAVVLAAWASSAHAARPLDTDTADVLGKGACQFDLLLLRASVDTQKLRGTGAQLGCGVGVNTQINAGYSRASSDGAKTTAVSLDGKTALVVRSGKSVGVGVSYGWIADRGRGTAVTTDTSFVNLIFSKSLTDRLTGHANIGWLNAQHSESGLTWNLATELAVTDNLDLVAETFGEHSAKPWFGIGARYAVSDRANLNASYAVMSETPKIKVMTVGVKLSF